MGEQRKKADGATWTLRVGLGILVVALLQACNEATRQWGSDYSSAMRTVALGAVFVVAAFAVKAWQAMDRGGPDE